MPNFWEKLKKPILCLAPMADVTDAAFRQIIAKYGKPDIFFTEFVSADGLAHPVAREKLLTDLKYGENERPIVAQIFGSNSENIKTASALCAELGFDGIDINMGCPEKNIQKQCACAALIKDPKLAREVIRAAKEGAPDLPISVKTRIGYNKNEIATWIPELLKENLAALTVHLRTKKEMSGVPAHWELMKEIVELRDKLSPGTLILGNGDVVDIEDAKKKMADTGCDGIMLGRAIFGNPFLFAQSNSKFPQVLGSPRPARPDHSETLVAYRKLQVMLEHTKLFEKLLSNHKNFALMKKHYKAYVSGFDGAKELRMKLMEAENALQVENITNDFLTSLH